MVSESSSGQIEDDGEWVVTAHDESPNKEAVAERIVWTHDDTGVQVRLQVLRTVCSIHVRAGGVDTTLSLGFPLDRGAALQRAHEWMGDNPCGAPPSLVGAEVGA